MLVCQSRYVKLIVVGLYVWCLIETVHVGGSSLSLPGVTILKYAWRPLLCTRPHHLQVAVKGRDHPSSAADEEVGSHTVGEVRTILFGNQCPILLAVVYLSGLLALL